MVLRPRTVERHKAAELIQAVGPLVLLDQKGLGLDQGLLSNVVFESC